MEHNIPEIHNSRKTRDVALLAVVILLALCSFGLGRLSHTAQTPPPVALCAGTSIESGSTQSYEQGNYVASKNGSVYHFPWCSGAQRIHEENLISFRTEQEAQDAGYRPAANCKGL